MVCSNSGGRRRARVALAALAIGEIALVGVANAALVAYEPFDYAVGSSVLGADGGIGFTGPWVASRPGCTDNCGGTPDGSNTVAAGSLAGPAGLPTTGSHAMLTGEFGTIDGLSRPFSNVAGTDGTTTWVSFIAQRQGEAQDPPLVGTNPYPRGANVSFFDSEGTSDGSGAADERFGLGNSSNATGNEWSIIPEGSGDLREGSANDPWSTLAWGVLRIDHVGDHTVADNAWLWLSPNPLGGEPDTASADVTILGGALNPDANARDFSNVDFIRPFVGNAQTDRPFAVLTIDEIRVGTTWNDMRAVPEPSGCVLAVLVGLVLYVRQRIR